MYLLLEKVIFLGVVTQRLYVDPQHSRQNAAFACEQLRELLCTVDAGIYWNIQQCLQFDPSDSYCCEAGSPVQIDGFRALMDDAAFARYISGKSIHIEPSKELKTEYLEKWSSDCPDVTHIKEIRRKRVSFATVSCIAEQKRVYWYYLNIWRKSEYARWIY